MSETTTKLNETVRYTVKDRRYIDGQYEDSSRTATVTHVIENYLDVWTGETVGLGYRVSITDHTDGITRYAVLSDADLTEHWINKAA